MRGVAFSPGSTNRCMVVARDRAWYLSRKRSDGLDDATRDPHPPCGLLDASQVRFLSPHTSKCTGGG